MNRHFQDIVLNLTGAKAITFQQVVQTWWSGYGQIVKLGLQGAACQSVVLKSIVLPQDSKHPRGWNTLRLASKVLASYN